VDQLALLRSLSLRDGFLARLRHRWWVLDRVAFALLGWLCHPLGGGGYQLALICLVCLFVTVLFFLALLFCFGVVSLLGSLFFVQLFIVFCFAILRLYS